MNKELRWWQLRSNRRKQSAIAIGLLLLGGLTLATLQLASSPNSTGYIRVHAAFTAPTASIDMQSRATPALRFAVAGDVGTGSEAAWSVANAMTVVSSKSPFDGLILLGDNVYPSGNPSRLKATVFDPFGDVIDAGATLLPVLGNHDIIDGNASGQISALGMPDRWYSREFSGVLFVGLDSNLASDPAQIKWLDQTLGESDAKWKIVAMHHPPYSAGRHGSDYNAQNFLVPLFAEHRVQLVMAGHDHDYQRSIPIDDVTYVVSGGGSKSRSTGRADFTVVSRSELHFLEISVFPDRMLVSAVRPDGRVIDEFAIPAS